MQMPSAKELDDLTAVRIVGFDGVNPHYRIATQSEVPRPRS
jgi:hypothetical protein